MPAAAPWGIREGAGLGQDPSPSASVGFFYVQQQKFMVPKVPTSEPRRPFGNKHMKQSYLSAHILLEGSLWGRKKGQQ